MESFASCLKVSVTLAVLFATSLVGLRNRVIVSEHSVPFRTTVRSPSKSRR